MASAFLQEISDDLTCQICLDTFKKPKVLLCVHSFCEECLKKCVKPGERQIKCPTCRHVTALNQNGVDGLNDNFVLRSLAERVVARKKVQQSKEEIPCESCTGKKAVMSRCLTCNDFLCESCVTGHKTMKVFTGHVVVTLDEFQTGNYDGDTEMSEPTCRAHNGEKMLFYCKTHHVPVCHNCIVLDHPKPEHAIVKVADAVKELRSSSQKMLSNLRQALKSTESDIEATGKTVEEINAESKEAQRLVDEKVRHLVTFIQQQGEQCKARVVAKCRQKGKEKLAEKEELELKKVRQSSAADHTETVLSHGTDIQVASAFGQIKQCMDELCLPTLTMYRGRPGHPLTAYAQRFGQWHRVPRSRSGYLNISLQGTPEWKTLLAITNCIEEGQASK